MTFLLFLFAHWVADFVMQSDRVAIGKSSNISYLLEHVAIYFLVLMVFTVLVVGSDVAVFAFIVLNVGSHFVIDFFTSKLNSKLYTNHRHWFFTTIGFDQFLHMAILYITYLQVLR